MFCRNCGKENVQFDAFCGACGQPSGESAVVARPQAPTASTFKIAIGVFLGIIAVIVLVGSYVGGVALVCIALAVLAILVAGSAFGKYLQ
jgi:uncharacterized membrane protein YvbJ